MRMIAVSNHKGGVGKTTTTINLGAGLARLDKKVLLVDLDPQAHLTYSFGIQAHDLEKTVFDLLMGKLDYNDVIIKKDGLSIIPSSLDLSGDYKKKLMSMDRREYLLKERLNSINGYDFVLFDCPPALGIFTLNALTTVKEIFIPLQTEFLALQGMSKLLKWVNIVQKKYNKDLQITGIIATRYNHRKRLNKEILEKVEKYFQDKLFHIRIRENIAIAEAPSFGQTIFEYSPHCNGAVDYLNLSKEVIEKGDKNVA